MIERKVILRSTAAAALALAVTASTVLAQASMPAKASDHADLRKAVERLTGPDAAPGALAQVNGRHGKVVVTSGVSDVETNAPVDPDSHFRIGSLTKPFTATVVLQLVGEGRIDLDAPVERYLPGVVRGAGDDGRKITVRRLLQHRSGLPDVLKYLSPMDILKDPLRHWEARELVDIALANPREFRPGERFGYSNTNYLLAGMIIERVTRHSYADEIRQRIIVPLGLDDTYAPTDDPDLPVPHPEGYVRPGDDLVNISRLNPTVGGAAGGMVSTASDINHFLAVLLDGKLLKPAQLREMLNGLPTGRTSHSKYGLGLEWFPVEGSATCEHGFWGHDGDMLGFSVRAGALKHRKQATVMVDLNPGGGETLDDAMEKALPTALCDD